MAMKKIAKFFFAAVAMTAAVSCVKELDQVRPVEMTGKAYVFSASFDAETKTVLDEETLVPMWLGNQDGDEFITVMEPGSVNTYVAEGIYEPTAEVTFVMAENGGPGLKGNAAFAVSPAGAWSCFNTADSVGVTVNFSNKQYAYNGTYDPAAPVAVAYNNNIEANPNFSFKNVSALLKFKIHSDSDPVNSVKIYALGGEALAGKMHLMEKADSAKIVPADTLATNWVEMEGLYGAPLEVETTYYIAVAPALLKNGIAVQFNNNEVETYTISKELNIQRNRIYDLGMFSYENSDDNNWYVIGNFVEGNANNVSKVVFEESGNNLVAKNVTFAEGQSFKIYNPALGQALYAPVKEVETDTWLDLTEANGYMFPEEGTYDIYIDYVDEVITGVALVNPGADAPEYLVPAGYYTWVAKQNTWDGTGKFASFRYAINIDLDAAEISLAEWYDDVMSGQPEMYWDPMLVGEYSMTQVCTNARVVPTHATSGDLFMEALVQPHPMMGGDPYTDYYMISYSNLTANSVNLYSGYPSDGSYVYVTDENGEPVGTWEDWDWDGIPETFEPSTYNYLSISTEVETEGDEYGGYVPVTAEYSETDINFAISVLGTGQYVWSDLDLDTYMETYKIIDLGVTEENVIRIATNYDMMMTDPETGELYDYADPRLIGTWLTDFRFDNYVIVPTGIGTGEIRIYKEVETLRGTTTEYFLIKYSGYQYAGMVSLHSPYEILDGEGNPVQAVDANGNPVDDAYWQGLGLEAINWMSGNMGPVNAQNPAGFFDSIDIVDTPSTPDGAQWTFFWDAMGVSSVIDLGVTTPGYFTIAYSMAEAFGPESGLPEELLDAYMAYASWEYEIIPDEENPGCGQLNLVSYNMYDEKQVAKGYYTDYNGTMFLYTNEMLGIVEAPLFIGRDVNVYIEQGGIM